MVAAVVLTWSNCWRETNSFSVSGLKRATSRLALSSCAWSRARLASACLSCASAERVSRTNSTSPAFTLWPSAIFTSAIWPSTRDLTATDAIGCTVPMASMRTGIAVRSTAATTTGTAGAMPPPLSGASAAFKTNVW